MRRLVCAIVLASLGPATAALDVLVQPCGKLEGRDAGTPPVSAEVAALEVKFSRSRPEQQESMSGSLIAALASDQPGDRRVAARLLVRLAGTDHERMLARYVSTETSVDALLTLAGLAWQHPSLSTPILKALLSCDLPRVRARALETASRQTDEVAQDLSDTVVGLWDQLPDNEKQYAIAVLAKSRNPAALKPALEAFETLTSWGSKSSAARVVARVGSREDSEHLVELWLTKTVPPDAVFHPQREAIFLASLDGIDGPGRPFIATLFDTETDPKKRIDMANAALDQQWRAHATPESVLDEFDVRFHAALNDAGRWVYPPLSKAAEQLSPPDERITLWFRILRMYPPPSLGSAQAFAALSGDMKANGDLERALEFARLASDSAPRFYERNLQEVRRDVTVMQSLAASHGLIAAAIPQRDDLIRVELENQNDFTVKLPSPDDGDLQIWVDCMAGARIISTHAGVIERLSAGHTVVERGRQVEYEVTDPGCRLEPETYIRVRILMFPSEANDTFIGALESTGFIRTSDGRHWIPSRQAPTRASH